MRSLFSTLIDLLRTPSSDFGASHPTTAATEAASFDWSWGYGDITSSHCTSVGASTDVGGINPATGLPMVGVMDVAGNPYGMDLHSSIADCSTHNFAGHDSLSGGCDLFSAHNAFSSHDLCGSHDSFGSSFGSSWD